MINCSSSSLNLFLAHGFESHQAFMDSTIATFQVPGSFIVLEIKDDTSYSSYQENHRYQSITFVVIKARCPSPRCPTRSPRSRRNTPSSLHPSLSFASTSTPAISAPSFTGSSSLSPTSTPACIRFPNVLPYASTLFCCLSTTEAACSLATSQSLGPAIQTK